MLVAASRAAAAGISPGAVSAAPRPTGRRSPLGAVCSTGRPASARSLAGAVGPPPKGVKGGGPTRRPVPAGDRPPGGYSTRCGQMRPVNPGPSSCLGGGPIPVDAAARFSNHSLAFCARRGCRRRQDGGVAAVDKLVLAPTRCPRGHALRPGRTLLRTVSCSCGRHTTWRCHCGEVIYRPTMGRRNGALLSTRPGPTARK